MQICVDNVVAGGRLSGEASFERGRVLCQRCSTSGAMVGCVSFDSRRCSRGFVLLLQARWWAAFFVDEVLQWLREWWLVWWRCRWLGEKLSGREKWMRRWRWRKPTDDDDKWSATASKLVVAYGGAAFMQRELGKTMNNDRGSRIGDFNRLYGLDYSKNWGLKWLNGLNERGPKAKGLGADEIIKFGFLGRVIGFSSISTKA